MNYGKAMYVVLFGLFFILTWGFEMDILLYGFVDGKKSIYTRKTTGKAQKAVIVTVWKEVWQPCWANKNNNKIVFKIFYEYSTLTTSQYGRFNLWCAITTDRHINPQRIFFSLEKTWILCFSHSQSFIHLCRIEMYVEWRWYFFISTEIA